MRKVIVLMLFVLASLNVAFGGVIVHVLPSFGPNYKNSSYLGEYNSNTTAVALGGMSSGVGTPAWYDEASTGFSVQMVDTYNGGVNKFFSWDGNVNPTGNYSNECGGKLYFGALIEGTLGNKVALSNVFYNISSSYFGEKSGNFSAKNYGQYLVGISSDGSGGWTYTTSGSGANEYEKVLIINYFSYSFATDGLGTPGEQMARALQSVTNFSFTAKFDYNDGLGLIGTDTNIVSVIPEPALPVLTAVGVALVFIRRKVRMHLRGK